MKSFLALSLLLLAPLTLLAAPDDDPPARDDEAAAAEAAVVADQLPAYPLNGTCVVSGEAIDGDPVQFVAEGRLYRTCCKGCAKKVQKDPETYAKKVIAAVVADQGARYPTDSCVVSSESLVEEGTEPIDKVFGTRLVRFCCNGCVAGYEAAPAVFLADLDTAWMDAQRPDYPMETCVVSNEPVDDEPVELLYGVTLVRLCCKGCKKAFDRDPESFVAKLDAARAPAEGAGG